MMKTKELVILGTLLLAACDDKASQTGQNGPDGRGKGSGSSLGEDADSGGSKSKERPKEARKIPVAEPARGQANKVISPYTGDLVDVTLKVAGDIMEDPKFPGDENKMFIIPEGVERDKKPIPEARLVPGKPGFVYSPHNNIVVDVTGMPPGALMEDPANPGKYLRVPIQGPTVEVPTVEEPTVEEPPVEEPPVEEPPATEEETESPGE